MNSKKVKTIFYNIYNRLKKLQLLYLENKKFIEDSGYEVKGHNPFGHFLFEKRDDNYSLNELSFVLTNDVILIINKPPYLRDTQYVAWLSYKELDLDEDLLVNHVRDIIFKDNKYRLV